MGEKIKTSLNEDFATEFVRLSIII